MEQSSTVNDEEQESEKNTSNSENDAGSVKVFDWEAAFAALERRRRKEAEKLGIPYVPPVPPEASLSSISNNGLVTISFTKDMQVLDFN